MNKFEFICRQLSRATPKTFEHYIITRIWHSLNDTELKFVTQQHITRPDGRALTDMYFPQLKIHIEVDEGHHKNQVFSDTMREADIINATGHTVLRVDATQDLERVHHSIYAIVTEIKKAKESQKDRAKKAFAKLPPKIMPRPKRNKTKQQSANPRRLNVMPNSEKMEDATPTQNRLLRMKLFST